MINLNQYPEYIQQLKQKPEFNDFTDNEIKILMDDLRVKRFPKGQVLFDQIDNRQYFYFVLNGLVRAERTDENGKFIFYTYIKRNLGFPYRGLFTDRFYPYTARAMTDIEIVYFPMATFERLLRGNQLVLVKVVQEMSKIISKSEEQIQQLVTPSARQRIIQALKTFAVELGIKEDSQDLVIPYPLKIKELAVMSGTTRETAGQVVKQLVQKGVITYKHKQFTFKPDFTNCEF